MAACACKQCVGDEGALCHVCVCVCHVIPCVGDGKALIRWNVVRARNECESNLGYKSTTLGRIHIHHACGTWNVDKHGTNMHRILFDLYFECSNIVTIQTSIYSQCSILS